MPCVKRAEREKQEAFIKQNQKVVDPYKEAKDNVDILLIMHRTRNIDPLIKEIELSLSKTEVASQLSEVQFDRLSDEIVSLIEKGKGTVACEIACTLRRVTTFDFTRILEALLAQDELGIPFLFLGASAQIRDELIKRVKYSPLEALTALAWIGDEKVVQHFHKWKRDFREEYSELFEYPHGCTYTAGWELTTDSERRNLYLPQAIPLEIIQKTASASTHTIFAESNETCRWCQRLLLVMFNLENSEHLLVDNESDFFEFEIVTCEFCAGLTNALYMEKNGSRTQWSRFNQAKINLPKWLEQKPIMPREILQPSKRVRSAYFTCEAQFEKGISQIGGLPSWIQWPSYPKCPSCETTMLFVGQVSEKDLNEFGESLYYAFKCFDCRRVTASSSQST